MNLRKGWYHCTAGVKTSKLINWYSSLLKKQNIWKYWPQLSIRLSCFKQYHNFETITLHLIYNCPCNLCSNFRIIINYLRIWGSSKMSIHFFVICIIDEIFGKSFRWYIVGVISFTKLVAIITQQQYDVVSLRIG